MAEVAWAGPGTSEGAALSDLLGADEEAQLRREMLNAAAALGRAANAFTARPVPAVDVDAVHSALAQIPALATRLRARGSSEGRAQANKVVDAVAPLIADHLSPALVKLALERTPVPGGPPADGGTPTAIDLAELYRAITDWLIKRDPRHPAIAVLKRGFMPAIDQMKAFVETAERDIDSPDYPDLNGIANALLRLDVMTWVLVTAGFAREAGETQARTRRLARSALRRATSLMNRCASTFALVDRVNLAGMIAEIDDLVLIFQRVRQGEHEEAPPAGETFIQSLGTQVIAEFSSAITALCRGIMDSFVAGMITVTDSRGSEVAGMIRALGKLHKILAGLKDDEIAPLLEGMTQEILAGLARTGQIVAAAVEWARAEKDTRRLADFESILRAVIAVEASVKAS